MKNRRLIFEILIVIVSGISIIINFLLFKDWRGILYYTILSNLLVFIFYGVTVIGRLTNRLNKTDKYYMIKGLLLISILCTMFVYNFTVASSNSIYDGHPIISGSVHILVPLMVLIECLLFSERKNLKYTNVIPWTLIITVYFVFINIYRILGGTFLEEKKYPYDIFNYDIHGIAQVTINGILLLIVYNLLGLLIIFISNKMKPKESTKIRGE